MRLVVGMYAALITGLVLTGISYGLSRRDMSRTKKILFSLVTLVYIAYGVWLFLS